MLLKRIYYWKGLKPSVGRHIQRCYHCQQRNKQVVKYATLHFDVATFPMQFISMDLIGEFHPPTSKGKKYALTVICMLTGYVFCVPLKTKTAEEVLQAYIDNVYSKFGGSLKILSDNSTEFKNKIFEHVAKELGVVYKLYTPPYHPASNGSIEGFHASTPHVEIALVSSSSSPSSSSPGKLSLLSKQTSYHIFFSDICVENRTKNL